MEQGGNGRGGGGWRHVTFLQELRVIGAFRIKVDDDPARQVAAGQMGYSFLCNILLILRVSYLYSVFATTARSRNSCLPRVINCHCK